MWIIEIDGRPAGLAQHDEHEDHPEHDTAVGIPDAVGIDYLLGEDSAGRGVGPAVLEAFGSALPRPVPNDRRPSSPSRASPVLSRGPCE